MKTTITPRAIATAAVLTLATMPAYGATYYWDSNDGTAGFGTASGTWAVPTAGTTTSGWGTSNTGVAAIDGNSVTTATTDAVNFGNGATGLAAGTINVSGTVASGNMTFASGSGAIVLSGDSINFAATSTITVNNASNTIGSDITGAATKLTKAGTGQLTLTGTNTIGGLLDVSRGTLVIDGGTTTANQLTMTGNSTTLSIINGGTLNATGGNFDISNAVSNTYISIVGGVSTSTLNLGTGRDFQNLGYNPPRDNKDMLIDGDGVAGSAVFVARDVAWGRSTLNSDLGGFNLQAQPPPCRSGLGLGCASRGIFGGDC